MSALCYDLAGYQANGFCVASRLNNYQLETDSDQINLESANKIINQITLILLKNIPYANFKIKSDENNTDVGYNLFKNAINQWYDYILKLKEGDYDSELNKVYKYYLNEGNINMISFNLFTCEIDNYCLLKRGIWDNLKDNENIQDNR